jgi:uncharacterized lipoprotein YbaY
MILRCVVAPPPGPGLAAGSASVRVEDVTEADAPAAVIASWPVTIGEVLALELPVRPAGRRWVVRAEVRSGPALAALTTVSVPVPAQTSDAPLLVPLTRV